jgi:hypothetical protein
MRASVLTSADGRWGPSDARPVMPDATVAAVLSLCGHYASYDFDAGAIGDGAARVTAASGLKSG